VSTETATDHRLEVDLLSGAFSHHPRDPERLAGELREPWRLELVRQRRLGFARAAELGDLAPSRFLDRMRELKITPFDLDTDELLDELA
jgi:predicted HTH domain antitoxin